MVVTDSTIMSNAEKHRRSGSSSTQPPDDILQNPFSTPFDDEYSMTTDTSHSHHSEKGITRARKVHFSPQKYSDHEPPPSSSKGSWNTLEPVPGTLRRSHRLAFESNGKICYPWNAEGAYLGGRKDGEEQMWKEGNLLPPTNNSDVYLGSRKRKICGCLPPRWFWVLAALLIIVGLGGIIGGAVGSKKGSDNTDKSVAAPSETKTAMMPTSVSGTSPTSINRSFTTVVVSSSPTTTADTPTIRTATSSASSTASLDPLPPALFDSNSWYILANFAKGDKSSLSISGGGPLGSAPDTAIVDMSLSQASNAQQWQIRQVPADKLQNYPLETLGVIGEFRQVTDAYYISSRFLGPKYRLALPGGKILPSMDKANDGDPGQQWVLTPDPMDSKKWVVGNVRMGAIYRLSVFEGGNELYMTLLDDPGAHWGISKEGNIGEGGVNGSPFDGDWDV